MSNHLKDESSPYLQMHANNPVDWYPWGEDAFQRARKEKKLVIVSIGYAACHWCHVMEKESFTDPEVAAIMNNYFISVKVDREERPDVDEIYMSAIQLMGGRGGWPLNAIALPDGRSIYAVTYLPSVQWKDLLLKLKEFYSKAPDKLREQAVQIEEAMAGSEFRLPEIAQTEWPGELFNELFERWYPYMDIEKGGYLNAPKFPLPVSWEYFLHYYLITKDSRALNAITSTLKKMAMGGIYDQIGGGFSRYSVDVDWHVPHFEKMLYDNAQLVSLYSHAFQLSRTDFYAGIIQSTLQFVKRELLSHEGAFYTSIDADSEGGEGTYYCWKSSELDMYLAKNSEIIKDYFSVTESGNFEQGQNILFVKNRSDEFCKIHNISPPAWGKILDSGCSKLLEIRETRPKPPLDDKILSSWNSLMIKGLIDAFLALGNIDYLEMALNNARLLKRKAFLLDGRLSRNLKPGKTEIPGFLDDYAYLADAWISIYKATLDRSWLDEAMKIVAKSIELFEEASTGLFFYTPAYQEQYSFRKKIIQDNVLPSPTAIMARVMFDLGTYLTNNDLLQRAEKLGKSLIPSLVTGGPYMAGWSSLVLGYSNIAKEVHLSGPLASEWNLRIQKNYLPYTHIFSEELSGNYIPQPAQELKKSTFAVVCSGKQCGLPIHSLDELLESLVE